jgi:hypothetical protein
MVYLFYYDLTISFILFKKIEYYEKQIGGFSLNFFVIETTTKDLRMQRL